jgi:hypothetical protein
MKTILQLTLLLLVLSPLAAFSTEPTMAEEIEIKVYRDPNCQCCHKWIQHLEKNNFTVIDILTREMANVKEKVKLPKSMASCHTALVDNYIIEGHVPANDIKQLLLSKPEINGLSVPQMPVGTPGMEMGERKDNFSVFSFDLNENIELFNQYTHSADTGYIAHKNHSHQ